MSWFGRGTFKQNVLDAIELEISTSNGMTRLDAVSEVAAVLAYLADTALTQDEALQLVKGQAKAEARQELIRQIEGEK